jgi:hypothetical protein
LVSPSTCSANVTAAHSVSRHVNRRTPKASNRLDPANRGIGRPPDVPAVQAVDAVHSVGETFRCPNLGMQRDCIHRTLDDLNDDPGQVRKKAINTRRIRPTTRIRSYRSPCRDDQHVG